MHSKYIGFIIVNISKFQVKQHKKHKILFNTSLLLTQFSFQNYIALYIKVLHISHQNIYLIKLSSTYLPTEIQVSSLILKCNSGNFCHHKYFNILAPFLAIFITVALHSGQLCIYLCPVTLY